MGSKIRCKRLLLLIDSKGAEPTELYNRLSARGLKTWRASNFLDAIEDLSDFTVKNRPDVVLLEVSPLFADFDALQHISDTDNDVTVVAMSKGKAPKGSERYFAHNWDQLEALIDRESGHRPYQPASYSSDGRPNTDDRSRIGDIAKIHKSGL